MRDSSTPIRSAMFWIMWNQYCCWYQRAGLVASMALSGSPPSPMTWRMPGLACWTQSKYSHDLDLADVVAEPGEGHREAVADEVGVGAARVERRAAALSGRAVGRGELLVAVVEVGVRVGGDDVLAGLEQRDVVAEHVGAGEVECRVDDGVALDGPGSSRSAVVRHPDGVRADDPRRCPCRPWLLSRRERRRARFRAGGRPRGRRWSRRPRGPRLRCGRALSFFSSLAVGQWKSTTS